ncbi:MAG: hypothetical protein F2934_10445 [Actinobacteria bacterium]|uniref:Unannotated protein n=1 Tax=freshwater metagenome TaxID=449393 RepID=A0A6J6VDI1_9ZZZZ|nr:hypothetical protein [Actinomycetota bacterium]MTB07534.1 hypothetical protein [Actinomycetota bacterium]
MSTVNNETLRDRLGRDRLASYLQATSNHLPSALRLYEWNCSVSGAMFELLGHVEITVRNALHDKLTSWCSEKGVPGHWFDNGHGLLLPQAMSDIEKAKLRLVRAGKPITPSAVVSELNFGFWRFLLTKRYRTTLWPAIGHKAFPNLESKDPTRFFQRIGRLHELRNRVAHHEPLHWRHLDRDFTDCLMAIRSVCTDTEHWARDLSRVEYVLSQRPPLP